MTLLGIKTKSAHFRLRQLCKHYRKRMLLKKLSLLMLWLLHQQDLVVHLGVDLPQAHQLFKKPLHPWDHADPLDEDLPLVHQ